MSYYAHPTASVDPGALVGDQTKVWHYSHVMEGARIGRDCILGQNVFVGRNVRIGKGVKVQNNVSVYEGVELEDYVQDMQAINHNYVLMGMDLKGDEEYAGMG